MAAGEGGHVDMIPPIGAPGKPLGVGAVAARAYMISAMEHRDAFCFDPGLFDRALCFCQRRKGASFQTAAFHGSS